MMIDLVLKPRRVGMFLTAMLMTVGLSVVAQKGQSPNVTYQTPPKAMADLVDAPPTPRTMLSPDHSRLLLLHPPALPSIEELAEEELRIAGLRINPANHGPSRPRGLVAELSLLNIKDGATFAVKGLPEGRILNPRWSPDGKHIAFLMVESDGISLWHLNPENGKVKALTDKNINAASGGPYFEWFSDSKQILAKFIPTNLGKKPASRPIPEGPNVQETTGKVSATRTYQDLLKSPADEALFEHFCMAQLGTVDLKAGVKALGKPAMVWDFDIAPSGDLILVDTVHRPYSYVVPADNFPRLIAVWNRAGKNVQTVVDRPLADTMPKGFSAVVTGPRDFSWRPGVPASLCWTEAQDGGDPYADAEVRERVLMQDVPFKGKPKELMQLGTRFGGINWDDRGKLAAVSEWWWADRKFKAWFLNPNDAAPKARLYKEGSWEDRYNDAGDPVQVDDSQGNSVIVTFNGGKSMMLFGDGASSEGDRPFVDMYHFDSGETRRLWRSEAPYFEEPMALLDGTGNLVLTRRESKTEPPNYFVRNLESGELRPLTKFPHPTPEYANISKELIKYEREDGVELTGTLYLPPGYKPSDGRLPLLLWAYPREFKSAELASQVSGSPYSFVRVSYWGAMPFLTQGYAVLDDPSMPIIGEGDAEPNDTFRWQLVANAKAAIDAVAAKGVADPKRVAIGGHSYGAFMVGNLLAHSELFRAGIARSGAYNRTLTPFGFQREERTFWEAPEVYGGMSPFFHAEKINEPLLMIHGEADNNPGTFPLQSERLFQAIRGLGGKARLVMLPFESHGYRARESLLHMLWETNRWLEMYVKPIESESPGGGDSAGE